MPDHFDAAVHQQLGNLTARVAELEKDIAAMGHKLDRVHDTITQASGSWKLLVGLGSLAAVLGGLVVATAAWLWPLR